MGSGIGRTKEDGGNINMKQETFCALMMTMLINLEHD